MLCCVSGGRKRSEHKYLWLSYVLWINSGGWNEWENPPDWPGQCLMKWGEHHRTVLVSRAKCALVSHGKIPATGTYLLLLSSNRDLSSCLVIFYLLIIQQPGSPYYQAFLPTLTFKFLTLIKMKCIFNFRWTDGNLVRSQLDNLCLH